MTATLVVFAREPIPGRVKTRLAATLGARSAAEIYRRLLDHTIRVSRESSREVILSLAETPDPARSGTFGLPMEVQETGDLGDRLASAFEHRFSLGAERVVIIGSDNAHLRSNHIIGALGALHHHQVVLGPADDGGYWLVGQRHPGADLFSAIPWSNPETLEATRKRLQDLGLEWKELDILPDVDTEEDLRAAVEDPRVDEGLRHQLSALL